MILSQTSEVLRQDVQDEKDGQFGSTTTWSSSDLNPVKWHMHSKAFLTCGAMALVIGCIGCARNDLSGQSVGEVVTNLVVFAQAGDTNRFTQVFKPLDDLQAAQLLGMIQRSGMLTNYSGRLQMQSETRARLNYHDMERRCHFQVELQKARNTWRVTRIWFCR